MRTGLKDNVRFSRERLAASNAELVRMTGKTAAWHRRTPKTAAEAQKMLTSVRLDEQP